MICADDVFKIGRFIKPHGIKGEINFSFDNDVFDRVDCPYLIASIDGIFVPFFVKEYRFKGGDSALITLEDVTTDLQAKRFSGIDVYFPRKYFDENEEVEYSLEYFRGFDVIDQNVGEIGTITDVDDSTLNILFLLEDKTGAEVIIPASEDFMTNIDPDKKILYVNLPEGLFE